MAYSHILVGTGTTPARPVVRRISLSDVWRALARGYADFSQMPSHAVFLCVIYPLLGILMIATTLNFSMAPLAFPLAAGFALVGPLAATGLYELSRRREAGLDSSALHVLDVLHSPSLGAIMALAFLLTAILLIWLAVAQAVYAAYFGYAAPASIGRFVEDVFKTAAGWKLIIVGAGVGFLFAAVTFTISVVSFPLLLDRDVGAAVALLTSIRVVAANPVSMALWAFIIAALLVIGSVSLFLGLTVVVPVLGHATWHLYRQAIEPDPNTAPDRQPREKSPRFAADFPAALFPSRRQN
jgi:uncharacterized membrane protein